MPTLGIICTIDELRNLLLQHGNPDEIHTSNIVTMGTVCITLAMGIISEHAVAQMPQVTDM